MVRNYLLLVFFGVSAFFIVDTVGRQVIVGGDKADEHEFPYQVSIEIVGQGHGCGGGIISDMCIISAASCVIGRLGQLGSTAITVHAGINDLRHSGKESAVVIRVVKIFIPMEYTPGFASTTGDIAILRLERSMEVARHNNLRHLKLPRNQQENFIGGITAKIAGFGWTWVRVEDNMQYGNRNDSLMHFAKADVMSPEECEEEHPSLAVSIKHLCARVKQQHNSTPHGVCVGDGGSPLVYDGTVIGIFTLGPKGCAERSSSGIYTRVSSFLTFIRYAKEDKDVKSIRVIHVHSNAI